MGSCHFEIIIGGYGIGFGAVISWKMRYNSMFEGDSGRYNRGEFPRGGEMGGVSSTPTLRRTQDNRLGSCHHLLSQHLLSHCNKSLINSTISTYIKAFI